MTVNGPPFYDENEWEPDGPTLKEILRLTQSHYLLGDILLSPHQMHTIQQYMVQEYGRTWKKMMQGFIDELTPAFEQVNETIKAMAPVVEAMAPPKPPKNGPQYNPHARRGKGGRRR